MEFCLIVSFEFNAPIIKSNLHKLQWGNLRLAHFQSFYALVALSVTVVDYVVTVVVNLGSFMSTTSSSGRLSGFGMLFYIGMLVNKRHSSWGCWLDFEGCTALQELSFPEICKGSEILKFLLRPSKRSRLWNERLKGISSEIRRKFYHQNSFPSWYAPRESADEPLKHGWGRRIIIMDQTPFVLPTKLFKKISFSISPYLTKT